MVAQFVDISAFQGSIDFSAYCAWARQWDGIARIAMKATEGTGFVDPLFRDNRDAAIAAGVDCIYYYHYGRPDLSSASTEADFMHYVVGAIRDSDMLILDYEVTSQYANAEWAYEWLDRQEANYGGKLPGIYASTAYIQEKLRLNALSIFPLWLADWQFTPDERPPVPFPWSSYKFVQYTDRGVNIPGIASTVDVNIFLGQEEEGPIMPNAITLSTPGVSTFFKANGATWQCLKTGFLIGGGILGLYQKFGGDALCGLTYLGLPVSNEQTVVGHPGVTVQEFERGCLRWDPAHQLDNPPGAGDAYTVHVEQDPRVIALQTFASKLQTQNALLQSQVADLENQLAANTLAQENAALLAKIAQAVKDLT